MLALTLHQPWAYCVAERDKDYENRGWAPPAKVIGTRIAIHAGQHFDPQSFEHLRLIGILDDGARPEHFVRGAVVATALVTGWDGWRPEHEDPAKRPGRWFTGPIGWRLRERRALREPVPCKGRQGLWLLPDDVEARVLDQQAHSEVARG
jgi:hypothetical protein